jgi:uncharacterized protein (TIGR03000 family)
MAPEQLKKPSETKKQSDIRSPAPVTMVVRLPEDAKLFIDEQPTTSTSGTRVFVSPPLAPEEKYSYTLTAQVVRNGQTLRQTKQVPVRPGEMTNVVLQEFPMTTETQTP